MFSATVTVSATPTSIRALVNAAVPTEIPDGYNGRFSQLVIIPSAATVTISSHGTVITNNAVALVANIPFKIERAHV